MTKEPLFLARHAFVCLANDHLVFLDLRRDKYVCLGREQSLIIQPLLTECGIIEDSVVRCVVPSHSKTQSALQTLVESGLLVHDETSGKRAILAGTEPPSTEVAVLDYTPTPVKFRHVRTFFSAAWLASMRLRWNPIERTVRHVERRKRTKRTAIDERSLIVEHTTAFRTLRRYYPRDYRCLFDSLTFVEFLAQYGIYSQWIFGVKLEPFGAHCWVQDGSTILNDTVANVRKYTPIMAI